MMLLLTLLLCVANSVFAVEPDLYEKPHLAFVLVE